MRKKVLIYVQAYNAEKTLERCLKSIEMQTYKEFECVIYDNGSKDDTEKIANRFSEKDGRFIVVHRDENDTTLFFRYFVPLFVEKYTGIIDYFCNLDSDDEYKADFLEKSITFLEKNELDLVASGGDFIDANTGKCVSKREVEQDLIIEDENFGSYFPIYHQFMRTIWGKLYRFSLLGKIDCERCMCMAYGGDTFFVFNILHFCKRIGIMNKNLHKYYMSLKSSSYTFSEKRIESDTKLLQEAITFLVYKVGYVSPMNQNFLMQVYKNAISDTIEVLFDSTEKVETKHYLLCKILDDFCTKLLIQKMWFDKEFADLFIKIASLMVADSQIVEEHYAEKLSLEDLADYAQYNRTYVSTLFKQMVGINFHEYLTRVRFQHALNDLTYTNENLTDIALKNGFPDLKTLTSRFRSTFHRTPAQYRAMLKPDEVLYANVRKYLNPNDTILREKLKEYAKTGLIQ